MFECWEDMEKHWDIVKFTCGLMHDPNKMVKHVLQQYVKRKISELQLIHQRNRIRGSEMEALPEITRESKSVNMFRNEYFQFVTQQKIPFPSQLYYFGPKDYGYIMDRLPNVHGPLKNVTLGAGKCAVIIYRPHLGFWEILNGLSSLRQFNQKIQAIYMIGAEEECPNKVDEQLGNSLGALFTEIESFEVYTELSPETSNFFLEQLQLSCRLETLSTSLTESTDNLHLLKSLKRLDLSCCYPSAEQRFGVCQQLRHLSRIQRISFGFKSIGFGGAQVLAESVTSWGPDAPLVQLDLDRCEI